MKSMIYLLILLVLGTTACAVMPPPDLVWPPEPIVQGYDDGDWSIRDGLPLWMSAWTEYTI